MKYNGQKVVVHIPQKNYWKKGLSVSATASEICSMGEKITVDDLYKQVVPGVKFRDTLKLKASPSGGHSWATDDCQPCLALLKAQLNVLLPCFNKETVFVHHVAEEFGSYKISGTREATLCWKMLAKTYIDIKITMRGFHVKPGLVSL